ncbi:cfem domain-containing protein [Neofusicoccum parvum]|nr:cfem domain-containing protein [Neofusicoccum parvum]
MLSLIPRVLLATTLVTAGALGAIDFSSLPECARSPILNTIGRSKCDPSKPQCLCKDDVIVNDLVALIAKDCSGDDLTKAVAFGRALCPNLATQTVATISDAQTTYTITLDHPAGAIASPTATTTQPSTEVSVTETPESSISPSETTSEEPTASVTTANGTSHSNGTGPEEFQGVAPEFGPVRLWSTILGIFAMGVIFAEL